MPLDFQGPTAIHFRKFEEAWLDIPVFQLFSEIVKRNPAHTAIKCGEQQLSYWEVYHQAAQIACEIRAKNPLQEPIGIALPNDARFPVAMLAALAAGCPYVPLDIDLPIARNKLIIEQSGIGLIITASEVPSLSASLQTINIDKLSFTESTHLPFTASPDDIAYIIYTSGSTGVPKGVYQTQRNLLHDVMQYTNSVHVNENDRLTLLYSPGVNGAIRDIYGALLNGATLVIKNLKQTGIYDLGDFISREGITIYHSIPNIFRTFLKLNPDKADSASVRLVYLAGDRIYNTDTDLYKSFFPADCFLYVGIGATEIATIYRQWFINHTTVIHQELIPLGYAVKDREMFLLNEENNPVSDGEVGEITVSSPYISMGYWKNPEQTAAFFAENEQSPGIRTYKTGDLGRINDEGLLEYIGRKDTQVKVNGYRIEISEIEGALMNHPSIDRCGVVLHTANRHNALFAFYNSSQHLSEIKLKNWLGERLPDYMIPQRCIQLAELPMLHNFKNDTRALKMLAEKCADGRPENLAPADSENDYLLQTLRRTWSKFLDEKSFEQNARWKDAGGDSLNAVNFLVQLESDLGTTLPTDWIHGGMAPDEIYAYLSGRNLQQKLSQEQIIYVFPALSGIAEETHVFLKRLSEYATVRILTYPKFSDTRPEDRNLQYVTSFINNQITDYDNPDAGFLGICSGALIMNHIIATRPLKDYSLVGIIEGSADYNASSPYKNFFERARKFLRRGDLVTNSINHLYYHTPYFKNIVHYLEKKKYYILKKNYNQTILWYIYKYLRPVYADTNMIYFGCHQSNLNKDGAQWKPFYKQTQSVALNGIHTDMLKAHNANIVIDIIAETFEKQKVGLL